MKGIAAKSMGSLGLIIALVATSCTWKMDDYWSESYPVDTSGGGDTDTDVDTDSDTDVDTDSDLDSGSPDDDAGTCEEDDAGSTCGDTDTETDTDPWWQWDGSVGDFEDFCGDPQYAIFTQEDGYQFDNVNAPYRGNATSPEIVIHGFSHFYCSHCRDASEMFKEVFSKPEYSERAVYYFRHFYWYNDMTMTSWDGHKAAHAAHLQGQFWPMHDAIYGASPTPYGDDLVALAMGLGLDMFSFTSDYVSSETENYLLADFNEGTDAGVVGTPTLFVNGYYLMTWNRLPELLDCLFGYETSSDQ